MLRLIRWLLLSIGTAVGAVLLGALTNAASACGGAAVGCEPEVSGRTVTVTVTGTLVRSGTPGSPGGGSTTVSVPVPCYLTASWTGKEYFQGIKDRSITSAGWDEWGGDMDHWPYPGWREHKDDDEGRWWTPTCRYTGQFSDYDEWDDFSGDYFLSYPQTFLQPGEQPPMPPVPPEMLLQAAQEAMEVPAPDFEYNPDAAGPFDTLVNMDTWFWLSDPTQDGSVTASAGGDSVRVDATLADVTFSAPEAGAVPCEGTGVEWQQGSSSECTLAFEQAGANDVTADTQWTLEWSYNGAPQGAVDPLSATFTEPVVVAESQALVNDVG